MKNSDVLLFFLFIYDIVITIIFSYKYFKMKLEYSKLDKYNEELNFELAKMNRKCYSKDKEE